MKVQYRRADDATRTSTAYLEEAVLPDGSYLGEDKYTDAPIRVMWSDAADEWVELVE